MRRAKVKKVKKKRKGGRKRSHPLVDLLVDGRLPVGGTRNFEPLHQWFDGQTLMAREESQRASGQKYVDTSPRTFCFAKVVMALPV